MILMYVHQAGWAGWAVGHKKICTYLYIYILVTVDCNQSQISPNKKNLLLSLLYHIKTPFFRLISSLSKVYFMPLYNAFLGLPRPF